MPPILAIIGRKNAGKTTLVVRIAAGLRARGVRVMTIKHGTHTFDLDPANTDTWRHYHEGEAERVAMIAPDKFAVVMRHRHEPTLFDVVDRWFADADLVLAEGFKATPVPKIEIHRRVTASAPLLGSGLVDDTTVRAMVTDDEAIAPHLPHFLPDDMNAVCDFVRHTFLRRAS